MIENEDRPPLRREYTRGRKDSDVASTKSDVSDAANIQRVRSTRHGDSIARDRIPRYCMWRNYLCEVLVMKFDIFGIKLWNHRWMKRLSRHDLNKIPIMEFILGSASAGRCYMWVYLCRDNPLGNQPPA